MNDTAASRAEHWEGTYLERGSEHVSWFQAEPSPSLELVAGLDLRLDAAVIDVGGGASTLVDHLVRRGHTDVTVLDIADTALDLARRRLGGDDRVRWVAADVLAWTPPRPYALWHDRAVFHFLVDPAEQATYLATLRTAVPDGAVVLGTFAPDGPATCSGLPVARYGPDDLAALLEGFDVVATRRHVHVTPWGSEQPFTFVAARRHPAEPAEPAEPATD